MQTNPAVEQSKITISPVEMEKVCGRKNLLKSQVLSSEWNT